MVPDRDETETLDFQSETTQTRLRPRPSHVYMRPRQDRDVWKLRLETVSRCRDRDYITAMHVTCLYGGHLFSSTRLVNDTRKCYLRYRYFLTKLSELPITMQKVSAILLPLLLPILFVLVICAHIFISWPFLVTKTIFSDECHTQNQRNLKICKVYYKYRSPI